MKELIKAKQVFLNPLMSVEESDKLAGVTLQPKDCRKLFTEDVDVYDKKTGKCIAKFRKNVIPGSIQKAAFDNLLKAATPTDARLTSTGDKKEDGTVTQYRIRKDGTKSKQIAVPREKQINSGVIGYYDRTVRQPYCRLTAFNMHQFEKFKKAYPIIKLVDKLYETLMPKEYKKQRKLADSTSQDFVIKDTSFSTVTVNKNWQTAVHKDQGDFKEGFGNLVALRKGKFTGGYFVVARWGCGFDLQNGDVLLVDVHQWHGNTPIVYDTGAVRLSLVMYYREKMNKCGTMKQELNRVRKRQKGDSL